MVAGRNIQDHEQLALFNFLTKRLYSFSLSRPQISADDGVRAEDDRVRAAESAAHWVSFQSRYLAALLCC